MSNRSFSKFSLFISVLLLSLSPNIQALEADNASKKNIIIPVIDNAQVFANFTEKLPAVLNYFTSATRKEIVSFYAAQYGQALSQEIKRGHLTLTYQQENHHIRVVISEQDKKRQVDVIIEYKTS